MADAPKKKAGRPAASASNKRKFYISLSAEGYDALAALCAPRGGLSLAKGVVIEEAIRRFHDSDDLVKRRPGKRASADS